MDETRNEACLQFSPVCRVETELIETDRPFTAIAGCFAGMTGTVVLASGGGLDCARYHILAIRPWLTFKAHRDGICVKADGRSTEFQADPLQILRSILKNCGLSGQGLPAPVSAGLFGYLSYDLKDWIEDLPRTSVDDTGLPVICMYAPSLVLVSDLCDQTTRLCIAVRQNQSPGDIQGLRKWFYDRMSRPAQGLKPGFSGGAPGFSSPFTRQTYMEAVEKVRQYIAAGHIYQVNLSQRFETGFSGSSFELFSSLFSAAPASFYAYVNAGDHAIVSTSPERFVMQRGDLVETRPIKGTRPRGADSTTDRAMAEELQNSAKDDAELSMIVDLMRNDLGRVCCAGTVEVSEHKRLEAYHNVFHLVSVVRGRLALDKDSVDIIRAAFPGGSITGCPKIRAMEIIDELEPCRRHVYTGSIGYISFHGTMDLSVAIRTAVIKDERMLFSVGGGVVFDSDPESEYEETLHKGRSVMSVFQGRTGKPEKQPRIWINGLVVPASEALIPAASPGFEYGYGFFETIRVKNARPHLLGRHMERFCFAWRELFKTPVPDLSWAEIIRQVACANDLDRGDCSVKIIAAAGGGKKGLIRPNLLVAASACQHRLEKTGKPGLDLAVYPHPRQSPLASHKTLNYLYYLLAGRWAAENGADEAVILNPDGTVSETNTANLLLITGDTVVRPESEHVLAGVMEAETLEKLSSAGFRQEKKAFGPEALFKADGVLATNSLMGPVGVRSLEGTAIQCDHKWIADLRAEIFAGGFTPC
ncbi:MAG: aminodeoxychorismate synthase component I [Desulfosalsimonas sp.]